MTLSEYIQSFPVSERRALRERLASACGCSEVAIRSYANGNRRVPAERCAPLERATGGAVTRHDLRPTLFAPDEAAA